jgi:hypothetical protein
LSRGRVGGGGSDRTAFAVKASCHTPLGALEPPDSLIERCFRDDTTTVDQIGVIRRSPPPTRSHRISSWRLSILIFCALLRTEYFTRRWYSVLLGVMLALGRLTKLQCLTALLNPLVVIAIVSLRGTRPRGVLTDETAGRNRTPTVVNIGLAAVTAVGLPVLWYAPNWGPVWSYMQATFFNSPSAAIADPYKVKVLLSFLLNYFDTGNGLEIVLLGALAGGIVVAEHHGHLRRMVRALNDVPEFFALCAFAASPFSRLPSPTKRRSATPSREWWVPPFWWRQRSARYGRSCHAACSVLSSSSTASPAWPGLSSPVFMSPPFRHSVHAVGGCVHRERRFGVVPDKVGYTLHPFRDLMGMTVLSGRTPFDVPVGILQDGSTVNPNTLYFYSLTNDTSHTFTTLVDLSPDQLRDLRAVISPYVILLSARCLRAVPSWAPEERRGTTLPLKVGSRRRISRGAHWLAESPAATMRISYGGSVSM